MSITTDSIKLLSNDDLFKKLKELGLDKGPVTATTRSIYEKKLINYLDNPNSVQLNQTKATISPKKAANSTDQDDIIILKTTKTQTSTTNNNFNDNDDDSENLNQSAKIPFEFKLLKETPQSSPVSHSSIYRETIRTSTSGGSPTIRMRQATTATSSGYSSMNDSMMRKQDATGVSNGGESSQKGFNWRLYSYIGFILFIIYLIYLYIQSTNPKNPLVATQDEQA